MIDDPAYLTVFLLFIFVIATIVIFQLKETLPSKSEIYIRPEKITEEEISFYREQQICLVCKNKISRMMYHCPKCDVLYCPKCVEALSNLENMCWVCNTPLDESKPVKPLEKKEEGIKEELEKGKEKPKK
jgi:hypothetical protein